MNITVDFGYWRANDQDSRRSLLYWSEADGGRLIYYLPGGQTDEVIASGVSEWEIRDRLLGWQFACDQLTVQWVRDRFLPWHCPSCYGRGYVSFNWDQGRLVMVQCWCAELPAWI